VSEETGVGAFSQATGRSLEDGSGQHQHRYRAYQFELISRHCGASVLEVGAGLGEFASQFTGLRRHVVTDVDPAAVEQMRRRFADRPEGPYSVPERVGRLPHAEASTLIYLGFEHPRFARDDGRRVVVSYCEPLFEMSSLLELTFR